MACEEEAAHSARADFAHLIDQLLGGFDDRFSGLQAVLQHKATAADWHSNGRRADGGAVVHVSEVGTDTSELTACQSEGTSEICDAVPASDVESATLPDEESSAEDVAGETASHDEDRQCEPSGSPSDTGAGGEATRHVETAASGALCVTPESQVRLALFRKRREGRQGQSAPQPSPDETDARLRAAEAARNDAVRDAAEARAALVALKRHYAEQVERSAAAEAEAAALKKQHIEQLAAQRAEIEALKAEAATQSEAVVAAQRERDVAMQQFDEILPQLLKAEEEAAASVAVKKDRTTLEQRLRCHERSSAARQRREATLQHEIARLTEELSKRPALEAAAASTAYLCRSCRDDVDDTAVALGRAEEEMLGLMQHNVSLIEQLECYMNPANPLPEGEAAAESAALSETPDVDPDL